MAQQKELIMGDENRNITGEDLALQSENAKAEGYITKQEVARRLNKSVRTIENWQKRGYIPFIKAGHSVLFQWADIQTHLQRNFRVCRLRR